jgi:hypothetical protein
VPRSSRRPASGSRNRRRTVWATVTATHSVPAANGYDSIDLLAQYKAAVGADTAGITIARMHLRVIPTTGLTAIGNNFVHGIVVSETNDLGTNVVGAPRPAADLHLDWMYWDWMYNDSQGSGLTELDSGQQRIDIKSKRKMHQVGQTLLHVVQVPASAAFPTAIQVTGRILLMLP